MQRLFRNLKLPTVYQRQAISYVHFVGQDLERGKMAKCNGNLGGEYRFPTPSPPYGQRFQGLNFQNIFRPHLRRKSRFPSRTWLVVTLRHPSNFNLATRPRSATTADRGACNLVPRSRGLTSWLVNPRDLGTRLRSLWTLGKRLGELENSRYRTRF